MKKLALIILNWNGANDTIECLESLIINKNSYDIFLLDNGSYAEDAEILEKYLISSSFSTKIVNDKDFNCETIGTNELCFIKSEVNRGFAQGNNFVSKRIHKEYNYILLLNNDTIVSQNSILSMLETIESKGDVAVTCDIRYNYDRTVLWNAGGDFKWYGDRKYYSQDKIDKLKSKKVKYIKAKYITGCALLVDCKYIEKYGLFTDKFFHGEEDYNFCLNIKKRKLTVGVDLSATIYHKVGKSINPNNSEIKTLRSNVVHYSNRIIDYKQFYGNFHWHIWRRFYIMLICIKRRLSGMPKLKVKLIKRKIIEYTNKNENVHYSVFKTIMNDEEIC